MQRMFELSDKRLERIAQSLEVAADSTGERIDILWRNSDRAESFLQEQIDAIEADHARLETRGEALIDALRR